MGEKFILRANNDYFTILIPIIWLLYLVVLLTSCSFNIEQEARYSITPSPVGISQKTSTPTLTSTLTPTLLSSTSTMNPALTRLPTLTPPPVLSNEDAQEMILQLLDRNSGCKFPCWWGITPGVSTWHEVYNLQVLLSSQTRWTGRDNLDEFVILDGFSSCVTVPESISPDGCLYQAYNFGTFEAIVVRINAEATITLSELLTTYGKPADVWVRVDPKAQYFRLPFYLVVYYPDQRIIAAFYDEVAVYSRSGYIYGCFDENLYSFNNPTLTFWSDELSLSWHDINPLSNMNRIPKIEDAIGMDVETFYQTYKNPNKKPCFESPEELWGNFSVD